GARRPGVLIHTLQTGLRVLSPLAPHQTIRLMIFFFASRRRHTTFSRDWSSDVCSSDLHGVAAGSDSVDLREFFCRSHLQGSLLRSEERRVGKECRSRWLPGHSEKKERQSTCALARDGRLTCAYAVRGFLECLSTPAPDP